MKIFLDTANVEEIRATAELGLLDGVTTNPTLLSKESAPYRKVLEQICEIVPGPVSAEVVSAGHQGMVREGKELSTIAENIVVKCPLTPEGLKAVRKLKDDGIRCNVTLCFSVPQAIFAAKAGALHRKPVRGPAGRYRKRGDGSHPRHRAGIPKLPVRDPGAGGQYS